MTFPPVLALAEGLLTTVLAAEESAAAQRADTRQMLVWLLVAGAVIAVASVGVAIFNRIARHWRYQSHLALFYGLCRVHGLDASARRLLNRVARYHRLQHFGRLFIEPKWLDPAKLDASFQPQAADLERLRNRLFSVRSKGAAPN